MRGLFVFLFILHFLALSIIYEASAQDCSKGLRCENAISAIQNAIAQTGLKNCQDKCPEAIMHAMLYSESTCGRVKLFPLSQELIRNCEGFRSKRGWNTAVCKEWYRGVEEICKELGKSPNECRVSVDFGMGPAQFMPGTWRGYEEKLRAMGIAKPDPWNLEHAVLAMALKLSYDGFCAHPFATVKAYNGSGPAAEMYANRVFSRASQAPTAIGGPEEDYKTALEELFARKQRLEVQYPEIFGIKPTTTEIGPAGYIKYLIFFLTAFLGVIFFAALVYGGVKWLLAGGDIVQIQNAKDQIVQSFLGVLLILGIFVLLNIIDPSLKEILIKKEAPKPVPVPQISSPLPAPRTVIAYEIPLGKLLDGGEVKISGERQMAYLTQENVGLTQEYISQEPAESEAEYNEIGGSESEWKGQMDYIENSAKQFTDMLTQKISDRTFNPNPNNQTFIEQVRTSFRILERIASNYSCPIPQLDGIRNLLSNFRENNEFETIKNKLEAAGLNPSDIEFLSTEGYSQDNENLIEELYQNINSISPATCASEVILSVKNLQDSIKKFKSDFGVRKKLWENIKAQIGVQDELENTQKVKTPNVTLKGKEYIYEGTVFEERLKRISELTEKINKKIDQIKKINISVQMAANTIAATVPLCNCSLCVCIGVGIFGGGGQCVGDPCLFTRPLLIAGQKTLMVGASTLPVLASRLEKDIQKMEKEIAELNYSVEKLTEGLEKAEYMIRGCNTQFVGERGSMPLYQQLFSLQNFLNYKAEAEKIGFEVKIVKPWPDINIRSDPYTYYCVEGPLIESISEPQIFTNFQVPFKGKGVVCERENEVGELILKTKEVVMGKEKMIEEMTEVVKEARNIIAEISRNPSLVPSQNIQFSQEEWGEFSKNLFKNMEGRMIKTIFKNIPGNYARDLFSHILKSLGDDDLKGILLSSFTKMTAQDFNEVFSSYLESMLERKKKEFTQAIFDGLGVKRFKKVMQDVIDEIDPQKLQEFWRAQLLGLDERAREEFFDFYLEKLEESRINDLYQLVIRNLSVEGKQKITQYLMERWGTILINPIFGRISLDELNEKIETLSEEDLNEILSTKIFEFLQKENLLRETLETIPANFLENAILDMRDDIKIFTKELLFNGIRELHLKSFIFNELLENNKNFFNEIISLVSDPDKRKRIWVEEVLSSLSGENIRNVFLLMNYSVRDSTKNIMNNLLLKYVPIEKMEETLQMINNTIKGLDEFWGEVGETALTHDAQEIRDALEKVSFRISELNTTINNILSKISLEEEKLRGFLQDIIKEIPESKSREIFTKIRGYIEMDEEKLIQLFNFLSPKEMIRVLNEMVRDLPEEKRNELLAQIREMEWLAITTPEDLRIIQRELNSIFEQILEGGVQKSKIFDEISNIIPQDKFAVIFEKLQSWIPKEKLNRALGDLLTKVPASINELLDRFLSKVDEDFFKNVFEKINVENANEWLNKVSGYLPERYLNQFIQNISQQLGQKANEILGNLSSKIGGNITGEVLGSVFGKGTGLKQNALGMAKLPAQFNARNCRCVGGGLFRGSPICTGSPGPVNKVFEKAAAINMNAQRISQYISKLLASISKINYLIGVDIKGDIYKNLANSRKGIGGCFSKKGGGGLLEEKYLFKCEDALRFGWIKKCDNAFNFVCCAPMK